MAKKLTKQNIRKKKPKVLLFGVAIENINCADFCSFMEDGTIRRALAKDVPTNDQPRHYKPLESIIDWLRKLRAKL
jgi:hypothetical protein